MSDYGHFTTMRVERDGVRGLGLHAERLRRDAAALFDVPLDMGAVASAATSAATPGPVILRLAVTAADHDLAHPGGHQLRITATVRPVAGDLAPLRLGVVTHARALPEVKHLGIVPELVARRAAQRQGYDDALFVDAGGRLSEGPTWSLLLVTGRRLVAPAATTLPSVTVRLLAERRPVEAADVRAEDLGGFDAALAVSAGWGIRRIAAIGATGFGVDASVVADLVGGYDAVPRQPLAALA